MYVYRIVVHKILHNKHIGQSIWPVYCKLIQNGRYKKYIAPAHPHVNKVKPKKNTHITGDKSDKVIKKQKIWIITSTSLC